jgi:DNA-binding transcriptional LysR family regulator
VLSNRSEDLLRREADIAVRMVRPSQAALFARKVGVIHLGFHAHPRYLKAHGTPKTMAELREHPLIGFDKLPSVRRLEGVNFPISRDLFAFRCDSDVAQYAALRAGFGIGVCQVGLARRDKLLAVLPGAFSFALETWVVMHEGLKSSRRMRLMFDHLVEHLRAYIATEAA